MAAQQQQANVRDYFTNLDQQIANLQKMKQEAMASIGKTPNDVSYNQDVSTWTKIDNELTNLDKYILETISNDDNYKQINAQLQAIVQQELLYLVRDKVESRQDGKALLEKQLELVKQIKSRALDKRDKDIDLFNRFKEYSRLHPETTYEQFLTKTL